MKNLFLFILSFALLITMIVKSQALNGMGSISGDVCVAFESKASNLVSFDGNGVSDIFVQNSSFIPRRVSISSSGTEANGPSKNAAISANKQYVAFDSEASNLVSFDGNAIKDVFKHNLLTSETKIVSLTNSGTLANGPSRRPSISKDGLLIAFESRANNIVSSDTDTVDDIYVRNESSGFSVVASLSSFGIKGNGPSKRPSLSSDGRFVAFQSDANNLVSFDGNASTDIFVRDLLLGTTEVVSVSSDGTLGNDSSMSPSISGDGRYVAFESKATNLVGLSNGLRHIYVHDRQTKITRLVSKNMFGQPASDESRFASISDDGKFISFTSKAADLVASDSNGKRDIFTRDWILGVTRLVNRNDSHQQANGDSIRPDMSPDGQFVAYDSLATNLTSDTVTSDHTDVFMTDLIRQKTLLISHNQNIPSFSNGESKRASVSK